MSTASLDALARGFRHGTLGYDELSAQLHAWAEAFPSLVDLRSLGRTPGSGARRSRRM